MSRAALVIAVAVVVWAALGCGGTSTAVREARPLGEDLVALVPSGAELVLEVDVAQLRNWDETERILTLLPPVAQARLAKLGKHWINDIDAAAFAAWRGERGSESLLLVRGDLDDKHLAALLESEPTQTELAGRTLLEAGGEAVLRLGPRLSVWSSAVEVRRVAEVIRGDLEGIRDARADAPLREALAKAPSAKHGRPAVLGAGLGGPFLNERLEGAGISGRTPAWFAFALAVGDGLDAVLVLGQRSIDDARGLRDELDRNLRDLKQRPLVRLFHLEGAFDLVFAVREKELRVAYRLPGSRLDAFLARMDEGRRALESMKPAKPKPEPLKIIQPLRPSDATPPAESQKN